MARKNKYTAKEIAALINSYFSKCKETKESPTLTGLALKLDIDRQTLLKWGQSKRKPGRNLIKEARTKVEENLERKVNKNIIGAIFNLKANFGWQDRTEEKERKLISVRPLKIVIEKSKDTN